MSGVRILVVDDEPFNVDIIAEYLEDSGHVLTLAQSGEEAWALLANPGVEPFDLVVLDRMMPGMDGIELMGLMKADQRLAEIPVIMQTAAVAPEQVREGLAAGAYYYLTKPFEPETLQTIVRAAVDDARARRDLMRQLQEHGSALGLLERAEFAVRTLDEAQGLAALLASLSPSPELAALGLSELLINGIEHGNLGIDFREKSRLKEDNAWRDEVERRLALPENAGKRVRIQVSRGLEGWEFLIRDEGPGFAWQPYLDMEPERAFAPNGRGIALARQLAFAEMEFLGVGNQVRAVVLRRPRP
ncbi:MAG: response regulator [Rhodocyclaceae bacterium]|jgi:CheY-like chemotaxis protein|nr:response regulator [Rhodocyclaceae bacterium]